jgi:hypothetical protein
MNRDRVLSWPQTGYYASALLIGVSALLFWLAVLEWHPLRWSRPALGLLGLALLLALLLARWHPPRRLFVYPAGLRHLSVGYNSAAAEST